MKFTRLDSHSRPDSIGHPPVDGLSWSTGKEPSAAHNMDIIISFETPEKSNTARVLGDGTSLVHEKLVGVAFDVDATTPAHSTPSNASTSKTLAPTSKYSANPRAPVTIGSQSEDPPLEPFPDLTLDPLIFDIRSIPAEEYGTSIWRGKPAPYSFLVHALVLLAATKSRIAILSILTNFLRILIAHDPESVLPALYLLSNSLGAAWEGIELGVGGSIISKVPIPRLGSSLIAEAFP